MKHTLLTLACLLTALTAFSAASLPWDNGELRVSPNHVYLQHENGTPFFWLGETGWLMPERLNREDAEYYLEACRRAGFNVVQVQTVNGIPARNAYGKSSMPDGFDFANVDRDGADGYWGHMDYLIRTAASKGIYIGMVCVWGGLVKSGLVSVEDAKAYGTFLAERYKDDPNIVWIIGGDMYGDVKTEVWEALARSIKAVDTHHLMTYHPFGRQLSAIWFNDAEWLDFNMFQSGHRNYGQSLKSAKKADHPEILPDSTEEDNWRYVEMAKTYEPLKPVVDGEPIYEGIPYGLHDTSLPRWKDYDVRRYAYWSVFAGSFGHTYGNNSIMQMHPGGSRPGAYGATEYWKDALKNPGFSQMQYLKRLILAFPYFERRPAQELIVDNGTYYERLSACRGEDYLLVYDYSARPVTVDLSAIAGKKKSAWWYSAQTGALEYIGQYKNGVQTFTYTALSPHDDRVLIVCDASKTYTESLAAASVTVEGLQVEHRDNPLGVDPKSLRLSWKMNCPQRGAVQTAYRLMVASSADKLTAGQADVWDSGKVASDASVLLPYGGPALRTSTPYYWKVQVWSNLSKETPADSDVATFVTGLNTEKDWGSSQWIGWEGAFPWEDEGTLARLSARYLRKEFDCRETPQRVWVHLAGLGLHELYVNGQRVGEGVMTPMPSDYDKHIYYNTYDVTGLVKGGANAVGVILGNGRYYPMRHNYKPYKWADYGYPKMRMVMIMEFAGGRRQVLGSNTSWSLTAQGPIVSNNEFDGEEYDARLEMEGWNQPGFQGDERWVPAQRVSLPRAELCPQPANPMKVLYTVRPKSLTRLDDGLYILDMGENMTGWLKIRVRGEAGHQVKLRFAEALLPDGHLSMANLRDAQVTDLYTLKGEPWGETWAPRFVTHGFQYVEISGWPGEPRLSDFTGEFVADEMANTGYLRTSDEVFNQTLANARRTIMGDYKGMPVDCPQRNERMPWLGDRTMGSYGESFLFDNAAFYAKWMQDICDAQRWDGALPGVAPAYWNYYSDDITWPAALFLTCDMLYRQYGDLRPIERHFDAMSRFMDYTRTYFRDERTGLMTADKYGDWCMPVEAPQIIHSSDPARLTDGKLIATAYFYYLDRLMVKFARLTGRDDKAEAFAQEAEQLKEAFNQAFYNADTRCYSNNTVTANVVALGMGMVPESEREAVANRVRAKIMDECGGTMSSGIIGNQWLFRQLRANGLSDVAWHLVTTTDYPSFGYMVSQGATSIWELWNGDKADPKMNSRNHVMQLGDLLIWAFEDLAGLRNAEGSTAFKTLYMAPDFATAGCQWVEASLETPYGKAKSRWKRDNDALTWCLTIPANSRAEAVIPAGYSSLKVNGMDPAKQGLKKLGSRDGQPHYSLPSGSYVLEMRP